jgi:hypothetical protein
MTEPHPEEVPLRTRTIYHTLLDDATGEKDLVIQHVYIPEGMAGACSHGDCGNPAHDPGLVGLILGEETALLSAEEALIAANRLTRAANLILESEEDRPDIERDMARFGAGGEAGS